MSLGMHYLLSGYNVITLCTLLLLCLCLLFGPSCLYITLFAHIYLMVISLLFPAVGWSCSSNTIYC